MKLVTCVAPVNIAVIKYWGKRNEDLILPLNDSISTTLCAENLCARTSVVASPDFLEDRMWLNGREEPIENPRLRACLSEIRQLAQESGDSEVPATWRVHICSENNFPTAAGLASSAAGYACLVYTLAQLYDVTGDISSIARRGSGSACRSVFGGFVRWHSGTKSDGSDSIATQVVPACHWPELRILILVVSDHQKKISSTTGMQRSVITSELLKHRVSHVLPERISAMDKAIKERDFARFAEITMKDSNQFHAVCLDTYPPAVYMNDTSHTIAHLVHTYNCAHGDVKVAYTFDAGPNACLYMLESEVPNVLGLIDVLLPGRDSEPNTVKGLPATRHTLTQELLSKLNMKPQEPGLLQYIISTKVGDGPKKLEGDSVHLLDSSGQPLRK